MDKKIIAKVAIMGAKKGCGWRYAWYETTTTPSGYKFSGYATYGMYPNAAHNWRQALSASSSCAG